jgi:hypothetical protein
VSSTDEGFLIGVALGVFENETASTDQGSPFKSSFRGPSPEQESPESPGRSERSGSVPQRSSSTTSAAPLL